MEQLSRGTTRGSAKTLIFVESFSLHDHRASARAVFVDVNIAVASREAVVLLEAEVFIIITIATATMTRDDAAAATTTTTTTYASSHAFKSVAIPSFTTATTRRLFKAVQVAGRGAIGRHAEGSRASRH